MTAIHQPRRITSRFPSSLLALALGGLVLGGCFSPSDPTEEVDPDTVFVLPDSDLTAVVRNADGDAVAELDEEHEIGVNDCPQLLGTVTVRNDSSSPASATLAIADDPMVALEIVGGAVEVPAGEQADIVVQFTCMAIDPIDVALELSLELDGRVGVFEIPAMLDVHEPQG